jgi:hypothetical protein
MAINGVRAKLTSSVSALSIRFCITIPGRLSCRLAPRISTVVYSTTEDDEDTMVHFNGAVSICAPVSLELQSNPLSRSRALCSIPRPLSSGGICSISRQKL